MASPVLISESPLLRVEALIDRDTLTLMPAGEMNEDFNFSSLAADISALCPGMQALQFDLSRVVRINSVGIREWLLFLERVQTRYRCRFLSVGETFIEQACVIPTLLGRPGTPVDCCLVPYLCAHCKSRTQRLENTDGLELKDGEFSAPAAKCAKCNQPMEFDGMDEEYSFFLKRLRKPEA